ncbi:MAG: TIGR03960 family B12-binding radical SAM protein [Candidatus Binatia bacterium]|nr:TIGR03960 family B12-binding radical SAM protein [Candidatus Binatia bacterium]
MSASSYESAYASILPLVQKPGRYLGAEYGVVRKDPQSVQLRVALAFPDVYEIAQSHPGLHILYDLLNRRRDVYAERVYAPWTDLEALLRQQKLPLVSLETFTPLHAFDILGFTLQYELTYTNLLNMLNLGGIPLFAHERDLRYPLVIAGGPCAFNPEPLAPFLDAVLLGDGEEAIHDICDVVLQWRKASDKEGLLLALRKIRGVYVPKFFEPEYTADGKLLRVTPKCSDYSQVEKRVVSDLNTIPTRKTFLVPSVPVVHDRPSIEVMRGCVKGCRFCQAGYIYRPLRERSPERVIQEALRAAAYTGQEELSLLSLSTGDYSCVNPVLKELMDRLETSRVAVSLPSTRVEALAPSLLEQIRRVRKTGFTLAPEAGTQRLRNIIQKEYSEEELLEAANLIFRLGWRHLKLYFMLGLPGETEEDLRGIADLSVKIRRLAPRGTEVVASVSNFVPKPHTPFQWVRQLSLEETRARQEFLHQALRGTGVSLRYHDARLSVLEGIFSRGDRRTAAALYRAFQLGCRFDGWTDQCRFDLWEQALQESGIDIGHELRRRLLDEPLPWDHLSSGVTKQFFQRELARAFEGTLTPDCSIARCTYCGACDFKEIRNIDYHIAGSKAAEHRGSAIRHWAADVVGTARESDDWEPRGWKKVHRPDLLRSPLRSPLNTMNPEAQEKAAQADQPHASLRVDTLGTAEEWLTANGEGALRAGVRFDQKSTRCRIRLRYVKTGRARFIGSVELTNLFYRAVRRARLPVAFSEGHHPLPRLSFGPALPFGIESESEFADLYLCEFLHPSEVKDRLNGEMPSGISIADAGEVPLRAPSLGKLIRGARYRVDLSDLLAEHGQSWIVARLTNYLGNESNNFSPAGGLAITGYREDHGVRLLLSQSSDELTVEISPGPRGATKLYPLLQSLLDMSRERVLRLPVRKVATLFRTDSTPIQGLTGQHPFCSTPA